MSEGDELPSSFTRKLQRLFAAVLDPKTGKPYSFAEAARAINARVADLPEHEQQGRKISATYVWQLAEGRRTNPTKRHMESLADLFGVPASYLFDDQPNETMNAALDAELELAVAMRHAGISKLAHRARGLSPGAIASVLSMIEHVRGLEGLPDPHDHEAVPPPPPSS